MVGEQVDGMLSGELGDESGGGLEVFERVVDAGNEGDADPDVGMDFGEFAEVFEDANVGDAGDFAVSGIIHVFEVVKKQVGHGGDSGEMVPGDVAAGIDGGVEIAVAAAGEEFLEDVETEEGFAAGKRDATAGLLVKHLVASDFLEDLVAGHDASDKLAGLGGAGLDATGTGIAKLGSLVDIMGGGTEGTDGCAAVTVDAAVLHDDDFGHGSLAFGIVTPPALEGASLEEDGGADPGPVVEGVSLNVEDQGGGHEEFRIKKQQGYCDAVRIFRQRYFAEYMWTSAYRMSKIVRDCG
jgi:hypothetical protein